MVLFNPFLLFLLLRNPRSLKVEFGTCLLHSEGTEGTFFRNIEHRFSYFKDFWSRSQTRILSYLLLRIT